MLLKHLKYISIINMVNKIMPNKVQKKYSWEGEKTKRPFLELYVSQIITNNIYN